MMPNLDYRALVVLYPGDSIRKNEWASSDACRLVSNFSVLNLTFGGCMFRRLLSIILVAGLSFFVMGQTGKISGIVKDKATGDPLPGVNVVLKGTFLGASTDVDGFFVILNVPPGTYSVSFSYIGYQPVEIQNVRVVNDLTKRLEVELEATTIELDSAIVVVAERPFFEVSATNTVRVLDAEEIERVPIKGIGSIVSINAGVVVEDGSGGQTDNATLNVRGGRGNETLFVVDGVPYNDLIFGNAAGTIPDAAIEQVSSQLGGFSAKYGSAQSAVVSITTKSGSSKFFGGLDLATSGIGSEAPQYISNPGLIEDQEQLAGNLDPAEVAKKSSEYGDNVILGLDEYGYRQITGYLGGPIIPGKNYTFFGSVEFIDTNDDDPRASGLVIPSAGINQQFLPDNESQVLRYSGKLDGSFFDGKVKLTVSSSGSFRKARQYVHSYAKFNSFHNPRVNEDVLSGSLRLSHILNETTFWDLTLRNKYTKWERMDGFWRDDLLAYGDFQRNLEEQGIELRGGDRAVDPERNLGNGGRVERPDPGVFHGYGRVFNNFTQYEITTLGGDFNFTKQFKNHLVEFGGTAEQSKVRYWSIAPVQLASFKDTRTMEERYFAGINFFYGYDLFGNTIESDNFRTVAGDRFLEAAPPKPVTAALYIQDKIEFQDFILNLGFRWDYFDPDYIRIKDPFNVLGFGNPTELDEEDFEPMPTESYVSPRIGFAFPVTEHTVFHAQYGVFRQQPRLFDLYDSWVNLDDLEFIDGQGQNNGHLSSENTTQYEFGFKQQFGNQASLDVTAYYKNVRGLTNVTTITSKKGNTVFQYITTVNADFGTIKGVATSFNLRRLGPVSLKLDYTLALAEGTGSSQSSSFIATFRNPDNETPKVIAPLEFDQRHTLTTNIDIRANKGEGPTIFGMKLLENAGANFLISFNSGRPYTPIASQNLLAGSSLYGAVTQTINSAYAAGIFRIDVRVDKTFTFGNLRLVPYLWVQNLLDRDNFNDVYRSTGEPDDTAFLQTPEGQQTARSNPEPETFISDYKALERNPTNYGIPRLIRLGLKIKF